MTGHTAKKAKPAKPSKKELAAAAAQKKAEQNARKEAQRRQDAAMGIKRIEVRLSARALDMVKFGCQVRGGLTEPYELNEYLDTLIRRDYARLQEQVAAVQGSACEQCRKPLPQGCGGDHPDHATCWFKRSAGSLLL